MKISFIIDCKKYRNIYSLTISKKYKTKNISECDCNNTNRNVNKNIDGDCSNEKYNEYKNINYELATKTGNGCINIGNDLKLTDSEVKLILKLRESATLTPDPINCGIGSLASNSRIVSELSGEGL